MAVQIFVEREEAEAQKMAAETRAIAEDAQRDLAEALPALKKPPAGVKLTMQATCIMFMIKPVMKNDPDNVGKKVKDYWEAAQKSILTDANKLLANLKTYDKDNIDEKVIEEIEPFMTMAEFTPDVRARTGVGGCACAQTLVRPLHVFI